MSKLVLPQRATLSDARSYIRAMMIERGFTDQTVLQTMLLLVEETGELAKSVRKEHGKLALDSNKQAPSNAAEEVADVFIVLLCLCEQLGIDIEEAFRDKEAQNKQRQWR